MFEFTGTLDDMRQQAAAVESMCASLDPSLLGDHEVSEAFDLAAGMHKRLGGALVRLSARYEEAGAWKANGSKSAADDIARATGTSPSRAKRSLDTSRRLSRQPGVDDAVKKGELSPEQADAVASGAVASPDDEDELLDSARKEPLHALRRRAAASRAKADRDREARRARQHRMRRVSRWTDDDGLYNLLLKLPPDMGAEIDASLKPGIDRAYADARDQGRFEPYEAYAADVAHRRLCGHDHPNPGTGPARRQAVRPDKKVIGFVDVAALNRGELTDGDTCEIAGVGPVSLSAMRNLFSDAFLTVVIRDGVDIVNVTHLGRQVTAHQRTALEARGYHCELDGCGSTHHLDIDHVEGWAFTHTTRIDDLAWACRTCHDRKTRNHYRLAGPPGARHFLTPDGKRVGTDPPARETDHPGRDPASGAGPAGRDPVQHDLFTTAR